MTKWFPLKKNNRFYNAIPDHEPESVIFGTIPSLLKTFLKSFSRKKAQPADWLSPQQIPFRSKELSITWIGHATFLIQVADLNILTDPVFGEVSSFFPRILAPGVHLDTLPSIDYVLISHNHWDHMDAASLTALKERHPGMQVLVPQGDKQWFAKRNFVAHEYSWWESHQVEAAQFSFLPAVHWSGRGLFDTNRSLWGSWMIRAGQRSIYFAGDTAYGTHFKQIAHEYNEIDVALMPIGPCEPKEWMLRTHMNVERSLQAFQDLGANHFLPMHWGTFPFGHDHFDEPISLLKKEKSKNKSGVIHSIKAGSRQIIP